MKCFASQCEFSHTTSFIPTPLVTPQCCVSVNFLYVFADEWTPLVTISGPWGSIWGGDISLTIVRAVRRQLFTAIRIEHSWYNLTDSSLSCCNTVLLISPVFKDTLEGWIFLDLLCFYILPLQVNKTESRITAVFFLTMICNSLVKQTKLCRQNCPQNNMI